MKLKFKKQDFQERAVNAVADLFKGQEKANATFSIADNSAQMNFLQNEFGFGNKLLLDKETLVSNLQNVQKSQSLPQTEADTSKALPISIEMETGTGKTYVYTKTILELHKRYGFTKFIIVVPSVAIREGVNKSFQITEEHFKNQYDSVPYRYFIYNSAKLSDVRAFATSNNIEIMIINIDAFKKAENIINQEQDKLNGETAMRYIQDTNPIVIIDEPQSVDNTPKAKEAIAALNPLCVLRYSATHREKQNLVYRLTPVDAYQMGLVKQICVISNSIINDSNKPYIDLKSVSATNGFTAKIEMDIEDKNGKVSRKTITVKPNDDLYVLSGHRQLYNKYIGKADKNQAFTPDHITEFMCRLTEVDHTKIVLDATCGSASFLVQAMVKELADCRKGHTEEEIKALQQQVKEKHIFGIEIEEKAFGLSVTNMLIHGDGNSNIKLGSCFDCKQFIKDAKPDIILMNPPYNAKPISIPSSYKKEWGKAKDGKEDPTKGLVFVHYLSDVIKELNKELVKNGEQAKSVKLAVLLPLACAIGTGSLITKEKEKLLEDNTLEAVFSLPTEMFYPGASVCACCMLFTLGQPHVKADGTTRSTFFGYCKDDGFVKKKNLGRVEQFVKDEKGNFTISRWKHIEEEWLKLYEEKAVVDGKSAVERITADDEWLCEAYMKTDYTKLTADDFQRTLNNYLSYLILLKKVMFTKIMEMRRYEIECARLERI